MYSTSSVYFLPSMVVLLENLEIEKKKKFSLVIFELITVSGFVSISDTRVHDLTFTILFLMDESGAMKNMSMTLWNWFGKDNFSMIMLKSFWAHCWRKWGKKLTSR